MLSFEVKLAHCRYFLKLGNIVDEPLDAIVNAANSGLMGGGGVDGAIHHAAGPALLEFCKAIVRDSGPLPPGQAVLTKAGSLKAKFVIHTVGPIWKGGNNGEDNILESCYREILKISEIHSIENIAFPSISTGAYGFPTQRAAQIAQRTLFEVLPSTTIKKAGFVLFDEQTYQSYRQAAEQLLSEN